MSDKNEGRDMSAYPSILEIRRWAQSRGAALGNRGGIPRHIMIAWDRVNPDRPFVKGEAYHGSPTGYNLHECRCQQCLEVGRAYHRERYYMTRDDRDEDLAEAFLSGESA